MDSAFEQIKPLDYDDLCTALNFMREKYPFMQCFYIGRSVLGRRIPACLIGSGRPSVLYVGSHHSLEYLTSMVLVRFIDELCEHMASGEKLRGCDVAKIMSRRSLYIVPMLNPDGVEIHLKGARVAGGLADKIERISNGDVSHWQANARGIDLNHNYNAGWAILHQMEIERGITAPAPGQFGGYRAESEPETHALCNLCRRLMFSRVYAFHSQGEEIYWNYGERTPRASLQMAEKLAASCGYTAALPEGLATHGGFKDWFINTFARPGFTIEIGKGENPLPPSDLMPVYDRLIHLLLLGLTI